MSEQEPPSLVAEAPAPTPDGQLAAAEIALKTATATVAELQRLLGEAQAKLAEISEASTQALAAKTKIVDDQSVIATKSAHIEDAQKHADKVRADLDRALTAATQQVTLTEGEKSKAQASAESAGELLAKAQAVKATVDADAVEVAEALKVAEDSAAKAKGLADRSSEIETRLVDYETRLKELGEQSSAQLKKVEELLPSATTTGLAHAFNVRRLTFLTPQNRWQWLFIGSVGLIVLVTASGAWHYISTSTVPTYSEGVRLWLVRLPIVAALVWLALYASRESALAKRLEEDYGFKAAVASCFEGFKKQMAEVGKDAAPDSPLAKLLDNTLTTIAAPPGRIYDKHELTVSPSAEVKALIEATVTAAKAGLK